MTRKTANAYIPQAVGHTPALYFQTIPLLHVIALQDVGSLYAEFHFLRSHYAHAVQEVPCFRHRLLHESVAPHGANF